MLDPDFINEAMMALGDRHKANVLILEDGVGILDYANYREKVGECRGLKEAAEILRDIANRWAGRTE